MLLVNNAAAADLLLLRVSYHPAADYIARAASSGAHSPKHHRSSPITPTPCRRPAGCAARVLQQPVSTRPAPPLSAPHSATSRSPHPRLFYPIYSYGTQHFAAYAEAVAEGQPSYDALSSAAKVRLRSFPNNTSRCVVPLCSSVTISAGQRRVAVRRFHSRALRRKIVQHLHGVCAQRPSGWNIQVTLLRTAMIWPPRHLPLCAATQPNPPLPLPPDSRLRSQEDALI